VTNAEPVTGRADAGKNASTAVGNLALRIVSAAVLAPLALAAAYVGGWPFALFWGLAALAVLWEWAGLIAGVDLPIGARSIWILAGIGYAGAMLLAPIVLRGGDDYGFLAMVLLFAIVWTTDVLGYFAGRAFGGPKLMPAISPKKTWSGAIAGTLGAMIVAVAVARATAVEIFHFRDHAVVTPATCGACFGGHMGVLGSGETCITASTRNFKGRMGDITARIYMASPATVAASAAAGHIAHPGRM